MTDVRHQDMTSSFSDPIGPLRVALRGRYEIERQIGQGAFATVYLARDLKHERKVALKVLNADPTSDTGELRFIREIRMAARLQHPNILPLHDSGHVEALLYYVMPYVSGETLRARIDRERQLSIESACSIAREAADALAYAHGQGIVHRDIKPENILLSGGHAIVADFGIARAIDVGGVRQLTRTGMGGPGTPSYMSPEQLLGDREIDGRSDTYSLGCVLYEMLTGRTPFVGKDGFVRRFTEPPPRVSALRREVPPWLDAAVGRALERNPADRYPSATEFVTALGAPSTPVRTPRGGTIGKHPLASPPIFDSDPLEEEEIREAFGATPRRTPRSRAADDEVIDTTAGRATEIAGDKQRANWLRSASERVRSNPKVAVGGAVGVLLVSALTVGVVGNTGWPNVLGSPTPIDSTRIAVLPFLGENRRGTGLLPSAALRTAMSEWQGLKLASDEEILEAVRDQGPPTSRRAAERLARHVGAGRFVWGEINPNPPAENTVHLYSVGNKASLTSIPIRVGGDQAEYARVAERLLRLPGRPRDADGAFGKTKNYLALEAYDRGHVSLRAWDLERAEAGFRASVNADPMFAPGHAWLAQIHAWRSPGARVEWRNEAGNALRVGTSLSGRDSAIAIALARMAERRYPEACQVYSRLTRADSMDFVGLYGLGQCNALDSLVIPSSTSQSGWSFRSRYSAAAQSYMSALRANPAAHTIFPFAQLQELMPIASTKIRMGTSSDGQRFAAYPGLISDTVIFVPYPLDRFATLPATETAVRRNAALNRNLDLLLEFATEWTRRAPSSAAAFEALADVLEVRGEIAAAGPGGFSALDAVRKARQVANPSQALSAASREAWLHFKRGSFVRARSIADSLLAKSGRTTPADAEALIGLAALTGRIEKTAELARQTNAFAPAGTEVPFVVSDAAARFFANAALGVCSDTVWALERRLNEQLANSLPENDEPRVRAAVKSRPLSFLAPCTGARSTMAIGSSGNRLVRIQQAFATGNKPRLTSLLSGVTADARTQRPGDVSLDFTYQVAWLRSAMGDTAGAIRQLDRALGALPGLSAPSLREPATAAAAGRAMVLRSELAAAQGDVQARRRWARAVAELWANADAPLQPVVARMRALAGDTSSR